VQLPERKFESKTKKTSLKLVGKITEVRPPIEKENAFGVPVTFQPEAINVVIWFKNRKEAEETLKPIEANKTRVSGIVTQSGKYINMRNLEIISRGEEVEETNASLTSSPFISFAQCPKCGEKMLWIKSDLVKLYSEIEEHAEGLNRALREVCKIFGIKLKE
jgi:hypothetical protein